MSVYAGELAALQSQFEEKGRAEASAHRPPSNAASPDQHEVHLRLQAESLLNAEQAKADAANVQASTTCVQLQQKIVDFEYRAQQLLDEGSALAVVAATLAEQRRDLVSACVTKMREQVSWRAFREKHRIAEEARYPDSRIMHFALLVVCALVETVVNAFFFENAQGLLGGFVVALGVSVLNIGTAAALGIGFRYKNLIGSAERGFGWFCLVLFLVLTVFFNALFAAFRSEYQLVADPSDLFLLRNAFSSAMAEAPHIFILDMKMADFMSFILFGIGLILSGFAFWKGYSSDDRHPGYSRLDIARLAAEEGEGARRALALERLKTFMNQRRQEVSSCIAEPGRIASQVSTLEASISNAISTLELSASSIQRDFELVLGTYRRANSAVRATPPPDYFSKFSSLVERIEGKALQASLQQVRVLRSAMDEAHSRFQPLLRTRLDDLNEQAAAAVTSTYSEFLRSIETESWASLDASVIGMSCNGAG